MGLFNHVCLWTSLVVVVAVGCKAPHRNVGDSSLTGVFDGAGGSRTLAPASTYVLKSSLGRLISGMTLVQNGLEDGAHVYAVTQAKVGDIRPDSQGVSFTAILDLSVTAKSSQYVALGASAGGTVSFSGQAVASFRLSYVGGRLDLNHTGLTWSRPLTSHVSVWTNARVLTNLVRQKAYEQASASARQGVVTIQSRLQQELSQGVAREKPKLEAYFREIERALEDVPTAQPRLWSTGGMAFFQHLLPAEQGTQLSPPPLPPDSIDVGFSFNQHFFEHLLTRSLAGKTLTMEQLQEQVCASFSKFYYKMCQTEPPAQRFEANLTFDADRPVVFDFNSGRMRLRLNMRVTLASREIEVLKHQTPQVAVTMDYGMQNRQFVRAGSTVEVKPVAADGAVANSGLYQTAVKAAFLAAIEHAVPGWMAIPAVPAYISNDPQIKDFGGSFVVMNPEHFQSADGWLSAYFTYCPASDTQTALGINMRTVADRNGTARLRVTAVHPRTPASRAAVSGVPSGFADESASADKLTAEFRPEPGLRNDDVIYSVDGSDKAVSSPEGFSAYLAGRSLIPERSTVVLKVGRAENLPNPDGGASLKVWMMIDFEVQLQKVCRRVI